MSQYCPHCPIVEMNATDYPEQVIAYIKTLPDEIKTPPEEYRRRLIICKNCTHLINHLCLLCGCYVEMRAAKQAQYCPGGTDFWQ